MIEISIHSDRWYDVIDDPEKFVRNISNTCLEKLKIANYQPIISILMADDDVLHKLNLEHRDKDKPTNVLSFSYEKLSQGCFLGDIAISVNRVIVESAEYETSIPSHTAYLILHGLLHLLGYDHEQDDEETKMQNLEEEIMAYLDIKKALM